MEGGGRGEGGERGWPIQLTVDLRLETAEQCTVYLLTTNSAV